METPIRSERVCVRVQVLCLLSCFLSRCFVARIGRNNPCQSTRGADISNSNNNIITQRDNKCQVRLCK